MFFHLFNKVKATGDVHISESAIGLVASAGATIRTAIATSQLQPTYGSQGMSCKAGKVSPCKYTTDIGEQVHTWGKRF